MQYAAGDKGDRYSIDGYRWEYGFLARWGDWCWAKIVDPVLRSSIGQDDITSLRRIRAAIQLTVLAAVLLLPLALFRNPAHVLTASGLLFDIAGALRLFLLEEIDHQIADVKPNEYGNYPSPVMRELIMPEGVYIREINDRPISFFYYKKRGVLFFVLWFRSPNDWRLALTDVPSEDDGRLVEEVR